jgi:hypothetical protein
VLLTGTDLPYRDIILQANEEIIVLASGKDEAQPARTLQGPGYRLQQTELALTGIQWRWLRSWGHPVSHHGQRVTAGQRGANLLGECDGYQPLRRETCRGSRAHQEPALKYAAAFYQQLGIGVLGQATTSSNAKAGGSVGELAPNGDQYDGQYQRGRERSRHGAVLAGPSPDLHGPDRSIRRTGPCPGAGPAACMMPIIWAAYPPRPFRHDGVGAVALSAATEPVPDARLGEQVARP